MDKDLEIISNFESVLKKQRTRQLLGLYRDDKSTNPGNSKLNKSCILSNLSKQIRAIQNADCVSDDRKTSGSNSKCKKPTFMPVNTMPGSDEVLHQKPLPKFETQGVSDTQLLNIIHDVEAMDPGGITQEFDLTFQHQSIGNDENETISKSIVTSPFPIIDISLKDPDLNKKHDLKNTDTNHPIIENTHFLKEYHNSLDAKTRNLISGTDIVVHEDEQIMNDITPKNNPHIHNNSLPIKKQELKNEMTSKIECLNDDFEMNTIDSQMENYTQIFNECIEIENNDQLDILIEDTDIPLSPILDGKPKLSKMFSPLVFNLDTFENFEQIAVPAIEESPNLETAKQIINSQIIGKELLIHTTRKPLLNTIDLDILATKKDDRVSPIIPLDQYKMKVEKLDELLEIPIERSDAKINFFEDEILFSSDEEVDSDLKTENLPFTCVLETSFYEKVGVVDKTMYVGFHTASNKSITISTDSFSKAIDILDFTKDEKPLKELVKLCDSNIQNEGTNSEEEETVIQNLKNKIEIDTGVNIFEDVQELLTNLELKMDVDSEDAIGYVQSQILPCSKQNNKTKKYNEKLKTEKNIVNLIATDNSCDLRIADVKAVEVFREQTKTISGCDFNKFNVSENVENAPEVYLKPRCQYKETNVVKNPKEDLIFREFQTACNERLSLSEKNIQKSKKVFQDICLKDTTMKCSLDANSVKISENTENNIRNTLGQHVDYITKDTFIEDKNELECGLQSEIKTNLYEKKEKSTKINRHKDSINKPSFEVDNKHIIKIFNDDRKLAYTTEINKRSNDVSSVISPNNSTDIQLGGFKTASNKSIISDIAVEKSKVIFQDLINKSSLIVQDDSSDVNKIMKRGEGKEKSLHANSLYNNEEATESHKENKDINEHLINKEIQTKDLPYTDFESANNNEILINNVTLLKTSKISDFDIGNFIIPVNNIKNFEPCPDAETNNTGNNGTDFYKTESDEEAPFYGFDHENNEEVREFEEAMLNCGVFEPFEKYPQKIKANKIDKKHTINDIHILKPNFQCFKTASDKDIQISTEPLIKIKEVLQDIDYPGQKNENIPSNTKFEGFHTASNKPVNIPVKALAKSIKVFEDIFTDNENNQEYTNENMPSTSFQGFQTASNKPVKISVEALAQSKKIFEDVEADLENNQEYSNENMPTIFQGFKTASNKLVTISAKALAKSKRIFQDINIADDFKVPQGPKIMPSASAFVGFQTASNKSVKISAEALARTKKIFQDINVIDMESPYENVSSSSKFHGFRTASNKKVPISVEALAKSRKVLHDIYIKPTVTENNAISLQRCKTTGNHDFENCKSEKIFKDIDETNTEDKAETSGCQGFKTASNKEVKISKDALTRSKKILQNIVSSQNEEVIEEISSLKGFQTASNKDVKISEEALARSKRMFEDIVDNNDFVEKGNKQVKISDKELLKHNKTFQDIELDAGHISDFQGFQTASKKTINISTAALEKSKQVFLEFDLKHPKSNKPNIIMSQSSNEPGDFGSKTSYNTKVQVPNEVLLRSKNLFPNLDTENKNDKAVFKENVQKTKELKDEDVIESIIDTQVINHFEKSLHTEDFFKESTPKASKRSGSPILSCPKAKRRKKFQIPYSQKVVEDKICISQSDNPKLGEDSKNVTDFNENYKKSKKYTLKDLQNIEKDNSSMKLEIDCCIFTFSFEDLLNFEFFGQRNDISNCKLTTMDIKNIFMENVNTKLIPEGWLDIHMKLILWKLISYEIRFPRTMKGITSAKNVLEQLKYRYNTELYDVRRPALRKIMEKDDTSYKTLVLCIVAVLADGKAVTSIPQHHTNLELLLTDGWYFIKASTDRMLSKLVSAGRLYAGCKIVTHGAELTGCEQGVAPWEDTSSIRLKIYGNSTRRAHWHARLGYHRAAAILTPLSSVMADGGKISKLRLFVSRVYPALYVEKFDDGSTVTRSERLEHLHQMKYEAERQTLMEKLYEEVEREMSDQDSPDSENMEEVAKNKLMDSGSQIAKVMKRSADHADFRNQLTSSQTELLQDHAIRERERLLQLIQTRVQDKMSRFGLQQVRNVVPLLKTRVVGVDMNNNCKVTKAFLSIWKPNDAVLEIIKEGIWIEVLNTIPTAIRCSEIQISAGRQSVFNLSKYKETEKLKILLEPLKRTCYPIKDLVKNPSLTTEYNEIDTLGFIFLIQPAIKEFDCNKHQFQNVYLTDADKNIICVNFWAGLKKFGFENVLDTGQIVACMNLQKRAGNTRKQILQFRVTEFSYFTKTPKHETARKMLDDLSKILSSFDKTKFVEECMNLRQNYALGKLHCNENISPYRMPNIDINSPKNKIFVDSPLHQKLNKIEENLNLTGLDFESTFKQMEMQELSPRTLIRKQQIEEKIARLRMYGEPPPLSPMHILNKSKNAGNSFKSPFSKSDVSSSVASKENLPNQLVIAEKIEDTEIQRSPVIMNRTYVKRVNVNPVKLNFDNTEEEDNKSEVIDDFGEEFDGSPPLSLE